MSGELAQRPLALHPVDNRPRLCTCTHIRASSLTAYQRCLLSTSGPGRGFARIPGRPGTAFAGVDSHRPADLDVYLQACTDELAQRLLALPPVDNRPQLCHASLCSAYRHCLLLTTGPSCVPARILGELAHRLPTLPPIDNRPWARTCMYTWASWGRITGVASCQTALDMYLHTCFGELVQHLPALRPIDNRLQLVSVELARRLPALPPVDTRPQLCTCTHTRAGLLTAYRHCLPPTTSHGCARIPRQAGASLPVLPPLDKQPWTYTCTHASVSWRSLYRRCFLLTIGSD